MANINALGTPITETFDTLATTGTSSTLPPGWALSESDSNADATYRAGTGSDNTGDTYSFGSSADRALGGLRSGSLVPTFGSSFTNNTGSTISRLDIAYTGEQWRLGTAGRTDRIDFQYSLDATSLTTGTWTNVDGLDFTTPNTTTTGAKDGNAAANRTAISGAITGLSIPAGATFWIRWTDFNASGADDGLGVDDFSLTAFTSPAGVTITPSGVSTDVTEGGATDTYTVVLNSQPTANVTIAINNSDIQTKTTTSVSSLTFTTANWNVAQTVTVTAVNDGWVEGNHTGTITHTATSTDSNYNGTAIPSVTTNITDNDSAAATIRITEYMYSSSATGEFVELTNVSNAAIDLTGWSFDDDTRTPGSFNLSSLGTVAPGESVIITEATAENFRTAWSLPGSVKVLGGNTNNLGRADEINIYNASNILVDRLTYNDQTISGSIRTQNVSGWAATANLGSNNIAAWVLSSVGDAKNSYSAAGDIGNPGLYIIPVGVTITQSGGSTDVTEGGATDSYTVVLNSQPTANVTIAINPDSQTTTSLSTLTFTSANWNVAQPVTVTAVDDALVEGNHTGTITHTASSTDGNYNGINIASVTANITDNEAGNTAPTIQADNETVIDPEKVTAFLSIPNGSPGAYVSGVINDPTDPARTIGIEFNIADAETAAGSLTVTATSSNAAVVSNANLVITGTGNSRNLKITPTGVGYSDITVTVSDGTLSNSYVIKYAASDVGATNTRFLTGTSDASTAIAIDANYMVVADDEDQTIRLYDRNNSGLPVASFDFTSTLGLSGSSEVDIEASTKVGNTIYWMGSHANNTSGNDRPNRERIFATQISGTGANTTLTFQGYYKFLEDDLIAWDNANGHGLGAGYLGLAASAAAGVVPEQTNGFNIEGLTIAPNGTTAYVAFRAPNEPTSNRTQGLIVPVTNFTTILNASGGTSGAATFGAPIQLDLGGRGIRSIERNASNQYIIIAGPAGAATGTAPNDFRLYTWTGNAADGPVLRSADLTALNAGGSFESIVEVPNSLTNSSQIQVLVDNGDTIWYNDGQISKDLAQTNYQKFRSDIITLGGSANIIINEIDSDTPGTDAAEFVELYDGGVGNSDLSGLVVVFYNGSNDLSYAAFDLDGYSTDANGYFVLGNSGVPSVDLTFNGNVLQNGADAVALYRGNASDFPNNTPVSTTNLIDAIAYDTSDADDSGLLVLLNSGQPQVNEDEGGNGTINSLQRVANGSGGTRNTSSYQALTPTPGTANATIPAGVTITQSGGTTIIAEGGATDTYTVVLNTQPTANVTVTITPDSQSTTSATTLTFTPANWNTAQTVTVTAVDDTVIEGTHSSTITHTASSSDSNYNNVSISAVIATITDNDVATVITKIHEIQGSGSTFNLSGTRTIEGIVVSAFLGSSKLNGFYVQEEDADADANSATSEGIFVFDPSGLFSGNVGDKVRVTGNVAEFTSGTTSSLTQLNNITNVVNLGANTLPTVTNIQLPVTSVADLERYEGMLVNVSAASGNLTVTEYFQLGRFGQVLLSATGASNQPGTDARLDQYTQFNAPSVSGYSAYLADIAKREIYLDDGSSTSNPDPIIFGRGGQPLSASNTLRGGDTVANITGILDQRFEGYRVQTSTGVNFTPTNPRPTSAPDVGSTATLKVASFNVLNYFNGDGSGGGFPTARGAENATEFTRQRDKIIQAIIGSGADVLGLMEVENDGYGSTSAIQDLVNGLNTVAGAGTYTFINPGTSLGTDQIAVGLIYKPGKVTPVGAAATIPDGYGTGAFDLVGRKPLVQTFQQISTGESFTAVVNHFKSKGSSSGGVGDADAGDGQGLSNGTRTRQAQDLAQWLGTKPTGTIDSDYLIIGDLNAYAKEDPLTTLAQAGYNNLLPQTSYSYVFDGQLGSLDHALASTSLAAQVTGAEKWHINADEPSVLDYNTNFKTASQQTSLYSADAYRSSDHDPVIIGLNLYSIDNTYTPPASRDALTGTAGNDQLVGGAGAKTIIGGAGNDQFVYTNLNNVGHRLADFEVGKDKIVLTQLLDSLVPGGYKGSDAITDGYVRLVQGSTANSTVLQIDRDGPVGSASFRAFLTINNVAPAAMNDIHNFVF